MRLHLKIISIALCLVLIFIFPASCRSQQATFEVNPNEGATIEFDRIQLDIPAGSLTVKEEVTIRQEENPPPLFPDVSDEDAALLYDECRMVGQYYEVDLPLEAITEPVTVQFQYSEGDIPEEFSEGKLFVVLYDDEWEILPSEVDAGQHTVTAELSHNSFVGVVIAMAATAAFIGLAMTTMAALSQKVIKQKQAKTKFDALHQDYMKNYQTWTPEKIELARQELMVLAAKGNIDYDPESLPMPVTSPEGGVAGGSGGGSSSY